jgi:CheY-like chemotaxis protein
MTNESHTPERRSPEQPAVEPVNILLVDDRPENLIALEATLKSREYKTFTANSGQEALDILAAEEIALVLLDIQMPGMDGYETARRIKSDPRTSHIPVMMVTAIFKEEPHIRQGYEAGAVDYIGKPFDIDVLRKKVGIYTQLHQHRLLIRRTAEQQKLIDAQLTARREELEHRSAQITTLLESIPEPIFVVWGKAITESNRAAVRLFGFDSYDQMAIPIEKFFTETHPRDPESGRELGSGDHPYFRAVQGEKSRGQILIRNVETNRDELLWCAAHPVRFGDKVLGVVMVHNRAPTS